MIRFTILLVLVVNLVNSQLNYEGNPFTEYTEYIAEESNLSERSARQNDTPFDLAPSISDVSSRPQKLYPIMENETNKQLPQTETADNLLSDKSQRQIPFQISVSRLNVKNKMSGRQLQNFSDQNVPSMAQVALNNFLNSKTPEESRVSLDYYLQSQQSSEDQSHPSNVIGNQNEPLLVQLDVQPISQIGQQQLLVPQQQEQQVRLTPQMNQGQQLSQNDPRQQSIAGQTYTYMGQPVIRTSTGVVLGQNMLQPMPLIVPNFQARNDVITSAMWRERMRRIRGKPFPFAQPKVAGIYKGPMTPPMKHKAPVEVIYTKPPGFHRGPQYEDASAWFPHSNYPPPQKDIYYSQLYAQSYDPHYYNYIAATGKIRPHLYGKLGKRHQEEQDDGIWSELYRGFKKHGLKNLMTPTFLLGMTLPVVTLMLSALVQKRSIARSDESRQLDQEDTLRQYLERLQRAMECYADRNSRDANSLDGC